MAKVMVSLPEQLLHDIDAEAKRRKTTRSGLLAAAARVELSRRDPAVMQAAVERLQARATKYGVPTAEDVRLDREQRDDRDRGRSA